MQEYTKTSHFRLYSIWQAMLGRCTTKTNERYDAYGGRGVTVCEEWLSFPVFAEWCIKNGHVKGMSIDRKNNDGNYSPSNCRIATVKQQNNNKKNNTLKKYSIDWMSELCELKANTDITYRQLVALTGLSKGTLGNIINGHNDYSKLEEISC